MIYGVHLWKPPHDNGTQTSIPRPVPPFCCISLLLPRQFGNTVFNALQLNVVTATVATRRTYAMYISCQFRLHHVTSIKIHKQLNMWVNLSATLENGVCSIQQTWQQNQKLLFWVGSASSGLLIYGKKTPLPNGRLGIFILGKHGEPWISWLWSNRSDTNISSFGCVWK